MGKTVVVLSGGLDSTVALYATRARGEEVIAFSLNYGQRHQRELLSARAICARLDIPHVVVEAGHVLAPVVAGSALTSPELAVPEGHYADESMKATVVPNRNMILLSLAAACAVSHGAGSVVYGAHAGDHAIYPDCRPEFVTAMRLALSLCSYEPVLLDAPFINKTKADIVSLGIMLGVPFEDTWSCYKGGDLHCGVCGTCVERKEAFALCGAADPTRYLS